MEVDGEFTMDTFHLIEIKSERLGTKVNVLNTESRLTSRFSVVLRF